MDTSKQEIANLLDRPVWQMSGREFVTLAQFAVRGGTPPPANRTLCNGVRLLAESLSCCEATLYAYKKEGVLDEAIVSHIGKRIVFDVEKARQLVKDFQIKKKNFFTK